MWKSTEHWALSTEQPLNLLFYSYHLPRQQFHFLLTIFIFFFCSFLPFHSVCTYFPFEIFTFVSFDEFTMWNFCIEWYGTWIESLRLEFSTQKRSNERKLLLKIKLQHFTWSICLEIHSHFDGRGVESGGGGDMRRLRTWQ